MLTTAPSRRLLRAAAAVALLSQPIYAYILPQPGYETVLQPGGPQGSLGAVACEAAECSTIGRDIYARGGNAIDSLIATTFCVGVVGMYHSGIGGGGFAMIRDANGNYEAVDFRETAPAAAHTDMYQGNIEGSIFGGLAVGVPSEVRGLAYIHDKYGSLPWKTLLQGAIHVARDGFRANEDLMRFIKSSIPDHPGNFFVDDPIWAEDFAPNGTLVELGDIMTRKRYANTLEKIAEEGPDVIYKGPLAQTLIDFINLHNGTMVPSDFSSYKVISRPVRHIKYRNLDLYSLGAPAAGTITFQILKTMERYPLSSTDWALDSNRNLTLHRFTEAMRFGYASRSELGDPDFVANLDDFESHMLSDAYLSNIRSRINDDTTLHPDKYLPRNHSLPPTGGGTSHIVTADRSGMAASLTTTINLIFGAQIMEPSSGIILNNEMNDFSIPGVPNEFGFPPSVANFIQASKRPFSSITPVIASTPHGTLFASVGAAGGSRIISATTQVLWHLIEHDMSAKDALRAPRLHDQLSPNLLKMERGFDEGTRDFLREKGHDTLWVRDGLSSAQGIKVRDDGVFEAAGEPRQKNSAGLTI